MKWEGREESSNVEDRRGLGKKVGLVAGGGGILAVLLALIFGLDPQQVAQLLGQAGQGQPNAQQQAADPEEERMVSFTKVILHDTEVVWDEQFRKMGKKYPKPELVLFSGEVESACGMAESAVGPFYCPGDAHVYIDLSFYRDMQRKLNSPGEFARAYVIAHEVGHHVQKLLGYSRRVDEARRRSSKVEATTCQCGLSFRPTTLLVSGPTTARRPSISWSRGTSNRLSTPPLRSATTGYKRRPAATSCPMRSPMARLSNACAGSSKASRLVM